MAQNKVNNNIKFYTFIDILSTYSDENTSISIKEINNNMNNRIKGIIKLYMLYKRTKWKVLINMSPLAKMLIEALENEEDDIVLAEVLDFYEYLKEKKS